MGCKQIAATGMVGVLLGAGSLLAGSGVASASTTTKPLPAVANCRTAHDDSWPAWVEGRPANIDPATAAGVYMWHDATGWHIRVTHKTDARRTFSGKLVTKGRFFGVTPVRLEGHDFLRVSADHHVVTFRFDNYGFVDGLDFRTSCAPAIAFAFGSDGHVLPAAKVTIGHDGSNPATDPFSIARS